MADEVKSPVVATKAKGWKYVGPGSETRKNELMPNITNLPNDIKEPRLGMRQGGFHADDLPDEFIEYVMATNTASKGWWVAV